MVRSKVSARLKTTLSGRCKVCGEAEQEDKRFLICGHSLCMFKYYHIRCLSYDQIASHPQEGKPCWYCPSCLCRVCLIDMDDDKIILCDGCDEGHHLYCLHPRRSTVPRGKWYCYSCTAVRKWEGNAAYETRILGFHRKDAGVKKACEASSSSKKGKKIHWKKAAAAAAAVQETQLEDEEHHGFELLCVAAEQLAKEDEMQVVPAAE